MDTSSSDLEFFDFKNASEEEVKEIQAILKGPGNNGCVELPWERIKENCTEDEGKAEETDPSFSTKDTKNMGPVVVAEALQFIDSQTPLSPSVAQLPPPTVEAFVTLPTTVGPYPNAPYFVSRTIPYLRAYPHMGMPFFACPIPGAGETNPYGQFVPVVPATGGHEKFIGQVENEPNQKNNEGQFSKQSKKKLSHTDCFFETANTEGYNETALSGEQTPVSSPVSLSSTINSDRPTSVPLVPLPVPPSTFAGTLPLHGYPPGLHTLPYTQMSGPQAPTAAMYYVPVFNHPYGSYISSPPSAPMVLPVNLRPEATDVSELTINKCVKINDAEINSCSPEEVAQDGDVASTSPANSCEIDPNVQSSNSATVSPEQSGENVYVQEQTFEPIAKNISEKEDMTDCNSSSDPLSKSISSSPDCIPENATADDDINNSSSKCPPAKETIKETTRDSSRCWADLFKKPCSEVNGIDRHISAESTHGKTSSTLRKDIANGKMYSVPTRDSIH